MQNRISIRDIHKVIVSDGNKLRYSDLLRRSLSIIESLPDELDPFFDGYYEISSVPSKKGPPKKELYLSYDLAKVLSCQYKVGIVVSVLRLVRALESINKSFPMSSADTMLYINNISFMQDGGVEIGHARTQARLNDLTRMTKQVIKDNEILSNNINTFKGVTDVGNVGDIESERDEWIDKLGLSMTPKKLMKQCNVTVPLK